MLIHRLRLVCLALCLVLFGPLSVTAAEISPGRTASPTTILVGYESYTDLSQLARRMNARVVAVIPEIGVVKLAVSPTQAMSLMSRPDLQGVSYVEPDALMHTLGTAGALAPNDAYRWRQWYLTKISATSAWAIGTGSAKFPVAIVDTGVDRGHPDLVAHIVGGRNFLPGADPSNYQDDNGHGTHVAGIAAAVTNNGTGIAGLGWQTPIYAVKVLDYFGYGDESVIAQGVIWAASHHAKVINLSLGVDSPTSAGLTTLHRAIQYAANQGALVVAASGNDGSASLNYPAAFPEVMSVGATDQNDRVTPFSNYGSGLDISAPGTSIYSTTARSRDSYLVSSYQTTATYGYLDGTSMSAAEVSGAAAVVWAHMPNLTATELKSRLQRTARDIGARGYDTRSGWGRLDLLAAIRLNSTVSGSVASPAGSPVGGATVQVTGGRSTQTTSTGTYRITGVPQGGHDVVAMKPGVGMARTHLWLADGTSTRLNLSLQSRGAIHGIVTSAATKALVGGATIRLAGGSVTATSGGDGAYTIWNLAPGTYQLTVSKSGYVARTRSAVVTVGAYTWLGFPLSK